MKQLPQNWNHLLIDSVMFIAFLITTAPSFSGLVIHEWLSLALVAALITHILLHWQWIVTIGKRLFVKTTWRSRLNYLLNALLFLAFTITVATGVLMSREALPLFGITLPRDRTLEILHRQASDLTVIILGLHVAIHWSWIVGMFRRIWPSRKPTRQPAAARLEEVRQ
ncbi:MAG: DUF4405 domain-containing protein [Chloroflexus sp.]